MDFPRVCPARWLMDQDFGMCISPHDMLYPFYNMHPYYYRPWRWHNQTISKEFGSTVENEKGNYKITLDVQHFRPNEVSVKVTDSEIIVEGNHEERADMHGFISRKFKRRYALPSHCASEAVTSSMSSDGVLTIIAEKKALEDVEKIIPIKMCAACPKKAEIVNASKLGSTGSSTITTAETRQKSEKNKENEEQAKRQTQIMLREEACCLLNPDMFKTIGSKAKDEKFAKEAIGIEKATENINATSTERSTKIKESAKSSLEISGLTEDLSIASTSMSAAKGISQSVIEQSSSSCQSVKMTSSTAVSGNARELVSDVISAELREAAENI